ncbi:DEDD exonuclease domain-containing protein [Antricoccus suffuscus]|uniref:DEDD exonuclease domain-containing protein n=1 Tax=Antricoccus suffuscus TaxID=1629062 RepID=UPI001EDE91B3|nr:DEDD exonuclease domain-containing protein [Antricoccus suffuscus]
MPQQQQSHEPRRQPRAQQLAFDELGEPLREVTFVVVDLETTGGSAKDDRITEIGAVKVRGGEVLGEFQTLVDPQTGIPPYIQVLTGITESMIIGAPTIAAALPSFLEFAGLEGGTVLVAHNAPFDVGFLKQAAKDLGYSWPKHRTVDTVITARRTISRDEVANCKLATLAPFFGSPTTPNHRALDDARATVAVLHGLFERLGPMGVQSLDELLTMSREVTPAQREKRTLAANLPESPGVYIFRDSQGNPLYVGKSKNIRRRVRDYFTASEPRARMREMVALATAVDTVSCSHDLEAGVRERRLIAALRPRYNRRSKTPDRAVWVKVTAELFPRLSVVRTMKDDGCDYLGPFSSRRAAEDTINAIYDTLPIRRCTHKLRQSAPINACALAELGKCSAPCDGRISPQTYAATIAPLRRAIRSDVGALVQPMLARIDALSAAQRYEEAQSVRDRAVALIRSLIRTQQLRRVNRLARLVAAAPDGNGGWELAVIRHGRLVLAAHAARGVPVRALLTSLAGSEESHASDDADSVDLPEAHYEETELISSWLDAPAVRLVELDGEYSCPVPAAASWTPWMRKIDRSIQTGRRARDPFAHPRTPRPLDRPQDRPLGVRRKYVVP